MATLTKIYSDIDFTFTKKPVTGDVALSYDEKAVTRSIRNLLSTKRYERLFDPLLGSNIDALLFENVSPIISATLEKEILNTIKNHEPRANVTDVNTGINVTNLDFNQIKTNLKTFLQSQDILKDYNYDGSALSVLLDTLAYNTQYNAYYLNMVANEMFLDTAIQRASVVSHAKELGYIPASSRAPSATINLTVKRRWF